MPSFLKKKKKTENSFVFYILPDAPQKNSGEEKAPWPLKNIPCKLSQPNEVM